MTKREIQFGPFVFVMVPNGIELNRVLNAMQTEYVGMLSWDTLDALRAMGPSKVES